MATFGFSSFETFLQLLWLFFGLVKADLASHFTLAMVLPSELLLESFTALNESLLCGHGFFLRGLPLRFGAIPVDKHLLDDVCAHESYSM